MFRAQVLSIFAVNQDGERVPGFEVNTLTVMANESYEEFARDLQTEYEEDGMLFGIFEDDIFSTIIIAVDEETGIKQVLGRTQSKKLVKFFKEKEYLDKKNKGTEALAKAIKEGTLEILEDIAELSEGMLAKVAAIVQTEFDHKKIDIKDRAKRVEIKVQKEALAEPFIELWDRIKYKTTYSLDFDTNKFIEEAANMLADDLEVRLEKLEYMKAQLENKTSGISVVNERSATFGVSEAKYAEAPDILSILQNETNLTRTTLIETLKKSGTLKWGTCV